MQIDTTDIDALLGKSRDITHLNGTPRTTKSDQHDEPQQQQEGPVDIPRPQWLSDRIINPFMGLEKPATLLSWEGQTILSEQNIALIYGPSKCGKSALVERLAAGFLGADQCFGFGVEQLTRPIIYCDTERSLYDATRGIHRVYQQAGIRCMEDIPSNFYPIHLRREDPQTRQNQLVELIYHLEPALVIVDVIHDLVDDPFTDTGQARQLEALMLSIADQYGTAWIVTTHTSLSGRVIGHLGQGLTRKCESALKCEKVNGTDTVQVTFTETRNSGAFQHFPAYAFDADFGGWISATAVKPKRKDTNAQKIRECFRQAGKNCLTYSELKEAIKQIWEVKDRAAEYRIEKLTESGGAVVHSPDGKYRLATPIQFSPEASLPQVPQATTDEFFQPAHDDDVPF